MLPKKMRVVLLFGLTCVAAIKELQNPVYKQIGYLPRPLNKAERKDRNYWLKFDYIPLSETTSKDQDYLEKKIREKYVHPMQPGRPAIIRARTFAFIYTNVTAANEQLDENNEPPLVFVKAQRFYYTAFAPSDIPSVEASRSKGNRPREPPYKSGVGFYYNQSISNAAFEAYVGFELNDVMNKFGELTRAVELPATDTKTVNIARYTGFVRTLDFFMASRKVMEEYALEAVSKFEARLLRNQNAQYLYPRVNYDTNHIADKFLYIVLEQLDARLDVSTIFNAVRVDNWQDIHQNFRYPNSRLPNSLTNPSFKFIRVMLIQVFSSLFYAYRTCKFMHGDLYLANIMMQRVDLNQTGRYEVYEFSQQNSVDRKVKAIKEMPLEFQSTFDGKEDDSQNVQNRVFNGNAAALRAHRKTSNSHQRHSKGLFFSNNNDVHRHASSSDDAPLQPGMEQMRRSENLTEPMYFMVDLANTGSTRATLIDFGRSSALVNGVLYGYNWRISVDIRQLGVYLIRDLPLLELKSGQQSLFSDSGASGKQEDFGHLLEVLEHMIQLPQLKQLRKYYLENPLEIPQAPDTSKMTPNQEAHAEAKYELLLAERENTMRDWYGEITAMTDYKLAKVDKQPKHIIMRIHVALTFKDKEGRLLQLLTQWARQIKHLLAERSDDHVLQLLRLPFFQQIRVQATR